jgi:hypothetical protein
MSYNPNQPRVPAGSPDGGQWSSDNPFAADAIQARKYHSSLTLTTSADDAMAQSFPLGGGFARPGAHQRLNASIDKAKKIVEAERRAQMAEAKAKGYERGTIKADGRPANVKEALAFRLKRTSNFAKGDAGMHAKLRQLGWTKGDIERHGL